MSANVIIIGAGGHAKVVADAIRKNGDVVIGFLDDDKEKHGKTFFNSEVLGYISDYKLFKNNSSFIIAIGSNAVRKKLSENMDCKWYTVIHPSAIIGEGAIVEEGCYIGAHAVINSDSRIKQHSIVNTRAIIEHDCVVGEYSHIAPNCTVCGGCSIGKLTWLGAASTVINGINICAEVTVGAGAAVVKNIVDKGTYVGVPAKKL